MYYITQVLFLIAALILGGLLFSAGVYLTHSWYFTSQEMHVMFSFVGPMLIVVGVGVTATGVLETHK